MQTLRDSAVKNDHISPEKKVGFPLFFALIPIFAGILPIVAGYALQNRNEIFMGYSKSEYAAHAAFIKFAGHGDFGNPFNLRGETPASWFNLVYSALGVASRAGIEVNLLNTISIFITAIFLVFMSWKLVCYFFPEHEKRILSFLLITCASGFGWLLFIPYFFMKNALHVGGGEGVPAILLIGRHTFDISFAQVSTIQTVMHPLLALETALIILFTISISKALGEKKHSNILSAGIALAAISLIHPYSIPVLAGATALIPAWTFVTDRKSLPRAMICCLLLSPFFAFCAYRLYLQSDIIGKISGTLTHEHISPHKIILAFSLVLALALWGVNPLWKRRRPVDMLVLSQILILLILFYGPYRPHKYLSYLMIPLCLVATEGIETLLVPFLAKRFPRNPAAAVRRLVFIAVVPSNIIFMALFLYWVGVDGRNELYISRDDFRAIQWLKENAGFRDVVMSSWLDWDRRETINYPARYLPQAAGVTTLFTEKRELIVDDAGKEKDIMAVFNARTPESERARILAKRRVNFIYFGPKEKLLGQWNPENSNLVEKTLDMKTVDLFRVKQQILK